MLAVAASSCFARSSPRPFNRFSLRAPAGEVGDVPAVSSRLRLAMDGDEAAADEGEMTEAGEAEEGEEADAGEVAVVARGVGSAGTLDLCLCLSFFFSFFGLTAMMTAARLLDESEGAVAATAGAEWMRLAGSKSEALVTEAVGAGAGAGVEAACSLVSLPDAVCCFQYVKLCTATNSHTTHR